MSLVLGLDAAWTPNGSSGMALVDTDHEPPLAELLNAAEELAEKPVDVIVVDMPLSHSPIIGRRTADRAISQAFGGRGCSTHSPSGERPGRISDTLRDTADQLGYRLMTTSIEPSSKALIETYPHPAILHLTCADYRILYEVDKRGRYWPALTPVQRRATIARELSYIPEHLDKVLADVDLDIDVTAPVRRLKAVEDVIDALVCCWVGVRWLEGAADAFGDDEVAIWMPHPQQGCQS